MSILFVDADQREFKFPFEIWTTIIDYFCAPWQTVYISGHVMKRIFSVTSKSFHQLVQKIVQNELQLRKTHKNICFPSFNTLGSALTAYPCQYGYPSLLEYAFNNGAKADISAVGAAAQYGHLDCLVLLDEYGYSELVNDEAMNIAAEHVQWNIIHYLVDKGVRPLRPALYYAVRSGSIEMVKYLSTMVSVSVPWYFSESAAESGNLEMVKFIEKIEGLKQHAMQGAARCGSIEILEYLLSRGITWQSDTAESAAIWGKTEFLLYALNHNAPIGKLLLTLVQRNLLDTLKILEGHNLPWDQKAFEVALKKGSMEMIKGLIAACEKNGIQKSGVGAVQIAAETANVECLKYIIEQGVPYDVSCFKNVTDRSMLEYIAKMFDGSSQLTLSMAHAFNLEALTYLVNHNYLFPKDIIDQLVLTGNSDCLRIVKYLQEQGCAWSEQTCASVAAKGFTSILMFLHENGCPWDKQTCIEALKSNDAECLLYAFDHNCPCDPVLMLDVIASGTGNLSILNLLIKRDVPWTEDFCTKCVSARGDLDMLKFAHENGAQWSSDTVTAAIKNEHAFACFKHLVEQGCPWDPQSAYAEALKVSNAQVVTWIYNENKKQKWFKIKKKKQDEKCCTF